MDGILKMMKSTKSNHLYVTIYRKEEGMYLLSRAFKFHHSFLMNYQFYFLNYNDMLIYHCIACSDLYRFKYELWDDIINKKN